MADDDLLIHETLPTEKVPAIRYVLSQENNTIAIYEKTYDNFGVAVWKWNREATMSDLTWIVRHLIDRFELKKNFQSTRPPVTPVADPPNNPNR